MAKKREKTTKPTTKTTKTTKQKEPGPAEQEPVVAEQEKTATTDNMAGFIPSKELFQQMAKRRQQYAEKYGDPPEPDRPVETLLQEVSQLQVTAADRLVMEATFRADGPVDLAALDELTAGARALAYIQSEWLNYLASLQKSKKERKQGGSTEDPVLQRGRELRKQLLQRLDVIAEHYPDLTPMLESVREGITRINLGLDLERVVAIYNDPLWLPRIAEHIVHPAALLQEALPLAQQLQLPEAPKGPPQKQLDLKRARDLQFAVVLGMLDEIRDMGRFIYRRSPAEKRHPYRDLYQVWRRQETQKKTPPSDKKPQDSPPSDKKPLDSPPPAPQDTPAGDSPVTPVKPA